jgi:uncharacterized membrane protein
MADATGYNIPISLSFALAAESGGPLQDNTNINFSGFQTSSPVNSNTPTQTPTANSAAAEGNAATSDGQPTADVSTPVLAPQTSNTALWVGGLAVAVLGIGFLIVRHFRKK